MFTLLHLNCRSIRNKVLEIELLLEEQKPQIVCFTEHWLSESELQIYTFPNYNLISYFSRSELKGGGTALYAQKNIKGKSIVYSGVEAIERHCEYAVSKIIAHNVVTLVICIYRSPNADLDIFIDKITNLLDETIHKNPTANIIICGDFNINFNTLDRATISINNLLNSYGLESHVNENTRVGPHSATLIDNIFSNINKNSVNCCIVETDISDHYGQLLEVAYAPVQVNLCEFKRFYSAANLNNFKNFIKNESWDNLEPNLLPNERFDLFYNTFIYYFEISFPLNKVKINQLNNKSWVSNEIKAWSQHIKTLFWIYKNTNSEQDKQLYLEHKRTYKNYIHNFKRSLNDNKIANSNCVTKETWQMFKKLSNNNSADEQIVLEHNDSVLLDPKTIAKVFNETFTNIKPNNCQFNNNIRNVASNFFIIPTDSHEVENIIRSMPIKHSCGIDDIPILVIKCVSTDIAVILSKIINTCFQTGIFPDKLKIAKTLPLYKKGNPKLATNYRPVSLLPVFSKVFEKIINQRLISYLQKYNILSPTQFGFLPKTSTIDAVYSSISDIVTNLERGNMVAGIYFDLSKAFDSLSHKVLLEKMQLYGVRGVALDLMKSYLTNRCQLTAIKSIENGCKVYTYSDSISLKLGVPQGSILGPTFFLIYVNDLNNHLVNVCQFADDTSCLAVGSSTMELSRKTKEIINVMSDWCLANGLILNNTKTNLIVFQKNFNIKMQSLLVLSNGTSVPNCKWAKFLGVHIDCNLNWEHHIGTVVAKVNKGSYILRYMSNHLSVHNLKCFYFAYVQSILSYGIIFWGSSSLLETAFVAQKRAIRSMLHLKRTESCKEHFKQLGILPLPCLYVYNLLVFAKKNPELFTRNVDVSEGMNTRGGDLLRIPIHTTELFHRSVIYRCIKASNRIPSVIREMQSLLKYKHSVKQYLLNSCFYSFQEFLMSTN